MDNLSMYIIWGAVSVFIIWWIKRKRHPDLKDLTPELLRKQRAKMTMPEYKKWLRILSIMLGAEGLEHKERGSSIPKSLIDALRLLEKEMEDAARQIGEPFQERKKISEEFEQYFHHYDAIFDGEGIAFDVSFGSKRRYDRGI